MTKLKPGTAGKTVFSQPRPNSTGYYYFNLFGEKRYFAKTTDNLSDAEIEAKKQAMVDELWAERLKNLAKQQAAKRQCCYDDLDTRGEVLETGKRAIFRLLKKYQPELQDELNAPNQI